MSFPCGNDFHWFAMGREQPCTCGNFPDQGAAEVFYKADSLKRPPPRPNLEIEAAVDAAWEVNRWKT